MIDGIIQWFEKLPGIADMLLHNGLDQTLIIFFLTLVFGLTLGLVLALGRMTRFKIIQLPVRFYLLIMRGTPLILQLYGFYFGLNLLLGIRIERTMAAVVAFSLN